MFNQIMVPVDLAHTGELAKSLTVASDLSKQYGAPVCYVGVATSQPSEIAHNPAEYQEKLAAFAEDQTAQNGHTASARTFIGHDPVADVDDVLLGAVDEIGADLVVMASHVPSLVDYLWPSNGGKIAAHSKAAVFVVR
ncbi:MAG: universal stress protein [Pseudomonadota bacterium]